jgi:hypothetical protein
MTQPLTRIPVVLRGASPQFQFQTYTGDGNALLDLDLRLSPTIDTTTSFVHIRVDGVPLLSWSLQQIVEKPRLNVGLLAKGLHSIELMLTLQVSGMDQCNSAFRDNAWIVINGRSALSAAANDRHQSLSELFDAWFVRGTPVRIAMVTDAGSQPEVASEQWLFGFWQADTALRLRHFHPMLATSDAGASADVVIGVANPARNVDVAPSVAVAISHDRVQMIASSLDALPIAGQILASPNVLDACGPWPCRIGPLADTSSESSTLVDDADIASTTDAVVARVADSAASGIRIEGPGTHVVSMHWQRSGSQHVASGSVLRGRWRASTQVSEHRKIVVDVRVNGVAIESFVVKPGLSDIEVSIPADLLQLPQVVVDVVVSISEPSQQIGKPLHCPDDDAPLWLWLDPATNLIVPRTIRPAAGLAGFGRRLQHRPALQLPAQALSWAQAQAAAPVLAAFASKRPLERWRLAQPQATSEAQIEVANLAAQMDLISAYIGHQVNAPYKTAEQTLVHLESNQRVVIYPAVAETSNMDNLDIAEVAAATLMSSRNQWVPIGPPQFETLDHNAKMATNGPALAPVTGQRAAARRRFQWWLAGAATLVFVALAMTFSRQRGQQEGAIK